MLDRQTDRQTDRRIEWIDLAKGLAIILVIVGHTVKFGGFSRNLIFSFHMPLFFLLSGYTFRIAENYDEAREHIRKNFTSLILPCLGVSLLVIIAQWFIGNSHTIEQFWILMKRMFDSLWWSSGVKVRGHNAAGMIWFIFSLFWAKTFIDVFNVAFHNKKNAYIFVFIGLLGVVLGTRKMWLPQNLDVTLVCVLFIFLGVLWKRFDHYIRSYEGLVFSISIFIWTICLHYGIYIEMASRRYPYFTLSILEAICGSFAICCLCKALSSNFSISKIFTFLGAHTLMIFYVHHIDWIFKSVWQTSSSLVTNLLRITIVLFISFLLNMVKSRVKRIYNGN